ncbi:hypothetical protein OF83DRAFT_1174643 [Amylostereum chailletii]|nr:hypothetical protein OF83DRAFT_1174643 [Amylostereum chailletii]
MSALTTASTSLFQSSWPSAQHILVPFHDWTCPIGFEVSSPISSAASCMSSSHTAQTLTLTPTPTPTPTPT